MLTPKAPGRPRGGGRAKAEWRAIRILSRFRNGHLHFALAAALVAVSFIAILVPISRTQATLSEARAPDGRGAQGGLVSALQSQAEGVARALASPGAQSGLQSAELNSIPGSAFVPRPLLAEAARIAARGAISSAQSQSSLSLGRTTAVSFTLHENGFESPQASSELTVGQALAAMGIRLRAHDLVSPGASSELSSGLHVFVQYSAAVRLAAAGEEETVYTHAATVREMLSEAGIELGPLDRVYPGRDAPVEEGMRVQLVTVREERRVREEPIEFDTVYVYDNELDKGDRQLVQAGSQGVLRREYRVRLIDGREVRRALVSETAAPPTEQVIAIGTYVRPTPAPTARAAVSVPSGGGSCARTMTVYATWYTAASAGGSGVTATGTGVYKGIVAVDPTVIPLGTQMYIPGYGYGVAADTGGGIKGYKIDLGYGANDVYDWRTRWVDICLY